MGVPGKNPYAKYGNALNDVLSIVRGMENNEVWAYEENKKRNISYEEYSLAKLHIHGEEAFKGDLTALFVVGTHLAPFDANESLRILTFLANNNELVEAMKVIATYYQNFYGNNPDERKKWLMRASNEGDIEAQRELALVFLSENNFVEAEKWMTESAVYNYPPAMIELSRIMKIKDEQAEYKMDSHTLYERRENLLVRAVNKCVDTLREATRVTDRKEYNDYLLRSYENLGELYMEYDELEGALDCFVEVHEMGNETAKTYARDWLYKLEHEHNYKIPDEVKQKIT